MIEQEGRIAGRSQRALGSALMLCVGCWLAAPLPAIAQPEHDIMNTGSIDPHGMARALRRLFGYDPPTEPPVVPPTAAPAEVAPALVKAPPRHVRRARGPCERGDLPPSELQELQALLNEILRAAGRDAGAIDGICGPRTVAAIRQFQATQHLRPDGVPTRPLLARVRDVGATVANKAMTPPPPLSGDPVLWRPEGEPADPAAPPPPSEAAPPGVSVSSPPDQPPSEALGSSAGGEAARFGEGPTWR